MPDGALKLELTGALADDLRAAARTRGLSPEDYVRQQLEMNVVAEPYADDLDWAEDERRLAEPGENIPLDEAFDRLEAKISALRAATAK